MYRAYKRLADAVTKFRHTHLLEQLKPESARAACDAWVMFTMGGEMY